MKASDFMIGDFVKVKPSGMVIKIAAVHHKKVAYHCVLSRLEWVRQDLLESIPLTPEVLKKNGIGYDYDMGIYGSFFGEDVNYSLELSEDDGEIFWTINGYEYKVIKLSYVHELQHALRLCGIEKEIRL